MGPSRPPWLDAQLPGYYGAVLLLQVVADVTLVRWFLDHGADPNLGEQQHRTDRHGAPERDSCAILEAAAAKCDVEVVRLLLDAGAKIQTGFPLHRAAGAAPYGVNPFVGPVTISKEDDRSRIPVMALLVERGADLNQKERAKQLMPGYSIMEAAMVGAVERVRWLLEHGANPEATGGWGNAVQRASRDGNEEMQRVITEGLAARRWVKEAKQ
ncbi:uncharacterized protein N7459_003321 [Penicillium hispanicum]|uniref:uncharacterized protein n=1 Tax=Penicillium hispanicum TaxID=1080232 RepID=UPI002540E49F|nr:uncharacterized protein N7459_003321 [Penicillium hispanicum]KAJ5587556.1 hypothetical protein N7459_003321 [Penicillium hispanicum]